MNRQRLFSFKGKPRNWLRLVIYTPLVALTVFFVWLNFFSPFVLVHITGSSMTPTFANNSWQLGDKKRNDNFTRGDVIVFRIKNETYIKRIVALQGDLIPVYFTLDDGQFYASIIYPEAVEQGLVDNWVTVPTDYIWVESDNPYGLGSGQIGLVNVQDVIATLDSKAPPLDFTYPNSIILAGQPRPKEDHHVSNQ